MIARRKEVKKKIKVLTDYLKIKEKLNLNLTSWMI